MTVTTGDDLLRAYLDAGDRAEYAAFERLLDPDVVTHEPGDATSHGIDEQIAAWVSAHRGLAVLRHEVLAAIESSGFVAGRVRVSGRHAGRFLGIAPTGRRIEVDQAMFATIGRGRITEIWEIVDTGSGLRQLGVTRSQVLTPRTASDDRPGVRIGRPPPTPRRP